MTDAATDEPPTIVLVLRAFVVLITFLAAQIIGGVAASRVVGAVVSDDATLTDLTSAGGIAVILAAELVVLAAMVWLARARRSLLGFVRTGRTAASIVASLPVLIVMVGPSIVANVGSRAIDASLTPERAALLVMLAISIGFAEEITFRGVMLSRLAPDRRPMLAIAVTTLLFGLPHLLTTDNFAGVAVNAAGAALAVGVPFACVRLRCGTLWGPIWVHATIDAWAFVHTGAVTVDDTPNLASSIVFVGMAAALAIGYLIWFRVSGRRINMR